MEPVQVPIKLSRQSTMAWQLMEDGKCIALFDRENRCRAYMYHLNQHDPLRSKDATN